MSLCLMACAHQVQAADTGVVVQGRSPMNEDGWSWPTAASNLSLRRELMQQQFSPVERRNVQTVLEMQSGVGRAADRQRWYSPNFKPGTQSGFQELDSQFGSNDYRIPSFVNRRNTIEQVIAKGDRVLVQFRITGNLNGPMFNFEGLGQPINLREMLVYRFDQDGKILEAWAWGEGFALYEQLGGTIQLPGGATP